MASRSRSLASDVKVTYADGREELVPKKDFWEKKPKKKKPRPGKNERARAKAKKEAATKRT